MLKSVIISKRKFLYTLNQNESIYISTKKYIDNYKGKNSLKHLEIKNYPSFILGIDKQGYTHLCFYKEDNTSVKEYFKEKNLTVFKDTKFFDNYMKYMLTVKDNDRDVALKPIFKKIYFEINTDLEKLKNNCSKKEPNNKELLKEKLEKLKYKLENKEYKGFKERVQLRKEITKIEYALEGKDYEKEMEKERIEKEKRLAKIEEDKQKSKDNVLKLSKLEHIEIPERCSRYCHDFVKRKYVRDKIKAYRGQNIDYKETGTNSGGAMYGLGYYTTTSLKYAKKFGTVIDVVTSDLPREPLMFDNQLDFNQFFYELAQHYEIDIRDFYEYLDTSTYIKRMGYDGAVIGKGKDMILVKY